MTRTALLLGRTAIVVEEAREQLGMPDVQFLTCYKPVSTQPELWLDHSCCR
jgi:hypothetical protein